jgi:Transposase DNA-binding/Transposase DDE domain
MGSAQIEAELANEVANGNFPDARLNARLHRIVSGLSAEPKLSMPQAFDEAGLEGAYRFLSNHRVTPAAILSGHFEATRQRCAAAGIVLVAHDTTSFSYRYDGEREGLGRAQPRNDKSNQAFYAHFSLALAADGTRRPLGIAGFKTWVREPDATGTEYQRWEDQIRSSASQLAGVTNAIHLTDREADDYEMFCSLKRDGHRFVVRCHHNRLLDGEGKLREVVGSVASSAERDVPLTRRRPKRDIAKNKLHPPREQRVARLSVCGSTVALKRPLSPRAHPRMETPPSLNINVVRVWEPDPPEGETAIEWYLYTTEPVETSEQQLAVVDFYRARWLIEEYIKAIKTGCDFERRQLQDYESLINLLAIFAPIACRLLLIRSEAAREGETSALNVVSQDELDVLRALGRRKLSETPTVRDIYLAIAALGGHIKYNGDPGWLTLARGFERLQALHEGWTAAKLQLASDQ